MDIQGTGKVIITFDATYWGQCIATRCDVATERRATSGVAGAVQTGTWWVLQGADSATALQALDSAAGLNAMVEAVQRERYVLQEGGRLVRTHCCLTGDGKAMMAGHPQRGCRCWACEADIRMLSSLQEASHVSSHVRYGSFLPAIPRTHRVGDYDRRALQALSI